MSLLVSIQLESNPMTKSDRARSYGFRVTVRKWADCDSFAVHVLAREGEHPSPINPRHEGEDTIWDAPKRTHGLALNGLTIRCYVGDYASSGVIIRPVEFEDVSFIDHRLAARMVKTFARIEREVARTGAGREIGDYVQAIGKAIGATWFVRETRDRNDGSWGYSRSDWSWLDIAALKVEVREQFARLQAIHRERFPKGVEAEVEA
jgi:hypothetical protein